MSRILKLNPVCKRIIWGGTRIPEEFGIGDGNVAEAWMLALHDEGICGTDGGGSLKDFFEVPFPVMIKLIDAQQKLSVQVHPEKTEMWYVVDCSEEAQLVYGLKEKFDESGMRRALREGTAERLLNYVNVRKGDVFFIPQGLVHAIGEGILIAEIQQNSNVTYRLYDYGRLQNGHPRQLHVDEAMHVIRDFSQEEIYQKRFSRGKISGDCLANCEHFTVFEKKVFGREKISAKGRSFVSVIVLEGQGKIGRRLFKKGDSFVLPAETTATLASDSAEIIITEYAAHGNQKHPADHKRKT